MAEKTGFTDCLAGITDAVRSGDLTGAKRYAGRLLGELDQHTFGLVADCVNTIERYPDRAEVHLRARWKAAGTDTDRAVIATFGAAYTHRTPPPVPTPRRPARDTAPRDERTEVRPDTRRTPTRRAELRRQDRHDALMAAYEPRAGVDDEPPGDTAVYASGLDYDRAAVPTLRGTPCVRCWLERAPLDYDPTGDDGLCGDCRDKGRPGIPSLPAGHNRADAVRARCAFLAATYPCARALLARWWKTYATPADRAVIADWVHHNPFPTTPAPDPHQPTDHPTGTTGHQPTGDPAEQTAAHAGCTQCGDPLDTTDTDLCPECHDVEQMVSAD
ncbi:hypothetical protein ABZ816_35525 [Actinosynnema sp. NPDC047251]|uniref:Uncharacterized protein n=1 Tax=Saccharothrix espanaensis (strain ATCC 51144 / DSM 44229 / JCM 9112 / NBRC 15066 / NRRL 15764) TaxID=1179773 RepID=K0JTM1_SACES|nr:hypothetical protein [Saccharothrix espanaensis]CCH29281.1 hypothetical protein BN6_19620 [Saccharothrix espanaensis DSM 44229]